MTKENPSPKTPETAKETAKTPEKQPEKEIGGFKDKKLPEPTRYGDWEVGGRCSDF